MPSGGKVLRELEEAEVGIIQKGSSKYPKIVPGELNAGALNCIALRIISANVCNEVTLAPREDTALRPEFGRTRPGMPYDHALSPVTCE